MIYKNTRTGITIETECDIKGAEWEKMEKKTAKKAAPTKKNSKETEGGKK